MKDKIRPQELKDSLNALDSTPIEIKEASYNIIIVQTPKGKMTVKTHLSKEDWVKEQQMKLKPKPKKKRK